MKLPHRREFLHLAAGTATLSLSPRITQAQSYPSRAVRCIVAYAPGGGTDIFVRLVGQPCPSALDNHSLSRTAPVPASNIGTEAVIRAPADGYTLLGTDGAAAINVTLYDHLNFNFMREITVVGMARGPLVMVVHPSVPATTISEFIAYVKASRGKIAMGSAGTGTTMHLAGELFRAMAGVDMTHVPYRGAGPATTDLLGGQVQVVFDSVPASIEHIRAGRLRALAVTTSMRLEALSDIPTVSDFVPGYEASQWYAIALRKSTPAEIIEKLNKEINAILADPKMKARLADLGTTTFVGSSADFGKFVADDTARWAKVIKFAGIQPG